MLNLPHDKLAELRMRCLDLGYRLSEPAPSYQAAVYPPIPPSKPTVDTVIAVADKLMAFITGAAAARAGTAPKRKATKR